MNNGVNNTNSNQTIPGVKVVMPSDKPVDASTTDAGAALSNAQRINMQPTVVSTPITQGQPVVTAVVQPVTNANIPTATVAPTISASHPTAVENQPVIPAQPVMAPNQVTVTTQPTVAAPSAQAVVSENQPIINADNKKKKKEKKKKSKVSLFLFLIILFLGATCGYMWYQHQQEIAMMHIKCTPVSTNGETKKLDLDSTIVKDLYNKVATTIREDLGGVELNDQLKLYLAYRQIATSKLYESNCNKFSSTSMEPFTCELTASFVPKAFKADVLQIELKKLFGEDTNIPNQNVQLGKTCIGGFQYIEERGEYVQGQCGSTGATLYRVEKELIDATSTESTIILTEKVKYYGAEGLDLTSKLVSGTYKYTFKLDMNYNYIYISKELAN